MIARRIKNTSESDPRSPEKILRLQCDSNPWPPRVCIRQRGWHGEPDWSFAEKKGKKRKKKDARIDSWDIFRRGYQAAPACFRQLLEVLVMGKRYYCDFCDRSFADTSQARKKHIHGVQHQRNRKLHYDSFKGKLIYHELKFHKETKLAHKKRGKVTLSKAKCKVLSQLCAFDEAETGGGLLVDQIWQTE